MVPEEILPQPEQLAQLAQLDQEEQLVLLEALALVAHKEYKGQQQALALLVQKVQ